MEYNTLKLRAITSFSIYPSIPSLGYYVRRTKRWGERELEIEELLTTLRRGGLPNFKTSFHTDLSRGLPFGQDSRPTTILNSSFSEVRTIELEQRDRNLSICSLGSHSVAIDYTFSSFMNSIMKGSEKDVKVNKTCDLVNFISLCGPCTECLINWRTILHSSTRLAHINETDDASNLRKQEREAEVREKN